jgi:hypothetical protein
MTPSGAWKIFQPELDAVCGQNWNEEEYEEYPDKRVLALNIEAGNLTPDVLDEIFNCTTRDWCHGRLMTAALTILAANDRLHEWSPTAQYWPRKPRTRVLLGKRWIIG